MHNANSAFSRRNTSQESMQVIPPESELPVGGNKDLEAFLSDENGRSYLADLNIEEFDLNTTAFDAIPIINLSTASLDSVPLPEVVTLTLVGLRSIINTHSSLECAQIVGVQVWKEQTGTLTHRFVLLELCRPRRKTIWLRLDRRKRRSRFRKLFQAFTKDLEELAHLAASKQKLLRSATLESQNEEKLLEPPTLGMLQHLLRIICDELPKSQDSQVDAWLFCVLLQQNLERVKGKGSQFAVTTRTKQTRAVSERVSDRLRLLRPFRPSSSASVMPSTLAIPGVVLLTIKQFCGESQFAAEAHITVLKRYKYRNGLKHEFIIGGARTGESAHDWLWVRIDRAAALDTSRPSIATLSSDVPAKDSIRIARTELELMHESADVLPRSTVSFAPGRLVSRQPTLRDLAHVVSTIQSVSPNYNLLKENCYFVASVIQEALTEMFAGALKGDPPTWARNHASDAAGDILRRLQDQVDQ